MASLYQELKAAGVPLDNHESDLYALACEASTAILRSRYQEHSYSIFKSQVDGRLWYDIPFAYEPFWNKVTKRVKESQA